MKATMFTQDLLERLSAWVGRSEENADIVTPSLVDRYRATLWQHRIDTPATPIAPLGIHWCLTPRIAPGNGLGPDGHPERGDFIPPVPLPRRMWASSSLQLYDDLRIGDDVVRKSTIAHVSMKTGRTGQLCFVSVDHSFSTARGVAISERQEIVFRGADGVTKTPQVFSPEAPPAARRAHTTDPIMLFRYSGISFNGHRIHYDRAYAAEEGYPDLVVHGPLQATLLLQFAADLRSRRPKAFSFRGRSPLLVGQAFELLAWDRGNAIDCSVFNEADVETMSARTEW